MHRHIVHIGLIAALFLSACQNNKKKEEKENTAITETDSLLVQTDTAVDRTFISEVVTRFVQAYNTQDQQAINELINPEVGITFIHRPGAMDWYEKSSAIDFMKPIPSYYPYPSARHNYTLTFESLPVYDCGAEAWDKEGLFVDVIQATNILKPIAENLNTFDDVELGPDYLEDIEKAERNSYRVVLTTEVPLVFHVKEIEGKWYVTILDRAYGDCSA